MTAVMLTGLLSACGAAKGTTQNAPEETATEAIVQEEQTTVQETATEETADVCARNNWELVKQPIDWDSKDIWKWLKTESSWKLLRSKSWKTVSAWASRV